MTSPSARLLEIARDGGLHHALILHGPDPRALRTVAMGIARALNCLNRSTGDDCISCSRIERGIHPDVHLAAVADDRKMISVEQVRSIVSESSLRPYEGRTKVFILDPADAMSTGAANALLKTLEEPTSQTVFCLVTRSPDRLLPTIRSRAQAIPIRPDLPAATQIADRENVPLHIARIRQLADSRAADRDELEAMNGEIISSLARFASASDWAALLNAAAVASSGEDEIQNLAVVTAILIDLATLAPADSGDRDAWEAIQARVSRETLLDAAEIAVRASTRLQSNIDLRLAIEQAFVALAKKNPGS
jgi:DNA polymerase III delta prime subunit